MGKEYDGSAVGRRTLSRRGVMPAILLAAVMVTGLYVKYGRGASEITYLEVSNPIERALIPFWEGNTMYDESLLMISEQGEQPAARMLFMAKRIVSVTNAMHTIRYEQGVDWVYEKGRLMVPEGSRIPVMKKSQLYPAIHLAGMDFSRRGGGYVLYREGSFFHEQQISITYTHRAKEWKGPVPTFAERDLSGVIAKLRAGQPLKLIVYGDSIAEGRNASGMMEIEPYLPSWGQLLVEKLRFVYKSEITFENPSVGGKDSAWGKAEAGQLVAERHPDLVILAFGMNDGTNSVEPVAFRENIADIIRTVRGTNPEAEFILVGTTLPNPESEFYKQQPYYKTALDLLAGKGIVVADMTGVHQELLKHKEYADMSGNHINHPNDFLMRWYAQFIAGVLVP